MTDSGMGSIGVFDSGVGGLSTLHAIRQAYPDEHLMYVADSGHAPYGDQAASAVIARAQAITHFSWMRLARPLSWPATQRVWWRYRPCGP